ncbi:Hypothetical protein PYTT_2399 [Akkermansia glycaniphila]|uniref:Morphogenetic protein n=2 Tax=Akkermansia glycaniphila TaxID=1679444 RepID=A0A1H6MDC4_9BACT|nr:Hypothetical protein PYTT_2399 [Akkermansia glycaniphila]
MSAPMVLANLARRKTQTRRMTGLKNIPEGYEFVKMFFTEQIVKGDELGIAIVMLSNGSNQICIPCPYGTIGDQLWVRERLWNDGDGSWLYGADHKFLPMDYPEGWLAKVDHKRSIPAIHMPRWASRIMLEITNIRVERLQDISWDDCMAEGVLSTREYGYTAYFDFRREKYTCSTPRESYESIIDSINGAKAWDSNPWVWVVEYKIIEIKGGEK